MLPSEAEMYRPIDPATARAAVKDVINEVFSDENLAMRSILSKKQSICMARALALAELWADDLPETAVLIANICKKILMTQVSTPDQKARGRNDMNEAVRGIVSVSTNNKDMMGKMDDRRWGGLGPTGK